METSSPDHNIPHRAGDMRDEEKSISVGDREMHSDHWALHGRYGPLTLKMLCLMTDDYVLEIGERQKMIVRKLGAVKASVLREFSRIMDMSPARAAACFNAYMETVMEVMSSFLSEMREKNASLGMNLYNVSTHGLTQALQQEAETIYRMYQRKITDMDKKQKKQIQNIRESSNIATKSAIEREVKAKAADHEMDQKMKMKKQKELEESLEIRMRGMESELSLSKTECDVLKERQRQLLKEVSSHQSWKQRFEEERDQRLLAEEQYDQKIRKLTSQIEEQSGKHHKQTTQKEKELAKVKIQCSQLKEKLFVERGRCRKYTIDASRHQIQTRSQSAHPKTLSSSKSNRQSVALLKHNTNRHVSFHEKDPYWDRRFSEISPSRRPSITFDGLLNLEKMLQDEKKTKGLVNRRASKVMKGRLSFLNPNQSPSQDGVTSNQVLSGTKAPRTLRQDMEWLQDS